MIRRRPPSSPSPALDQPCCVPSFRNDNWYSPPLPVLAYDGFFPSFLRLGRDGKRPPPSPFPLSRYFLAWTWTCCFEVPPYRRMLFPLPPLDSPFPPLNRWEPETSLSHSRICLFTLLSLLMARQRKNERACLSPWKTKAPTPQPSPPWIAIRLFSSEYKSVPSPPSNSPHPWPMAACFPLF